MEIDKTSIQKVIIAGVIIPLISAILLLIFGVVIPLLQQALNLEESIVFEFILWLIFNVYLTLIILRKAFRIIDKRNSSKPE